MHSIRARAVCGILLTSSVASVASAQWSFAASGTTAEFRGLSAVSDRVVRASGSGGTVARTEDGGLSWRTDSVPGATHVDFRSIHAFDAKTAIVASAGEAAFAASGSSLSLGANGAIRIGTGGGGRGRVMLSSDHGRTWRVVETPVHAQGGAAGIFALDFVEGRGAIAVGGDYTQPRLAASSVALSRDGGATWHAARNPPGAYLSGVSFERGGQRIVTVGLAGTFVSSDGGESWAQTDTIPLNVVRATKAGWFAAGPRGRLARATP